MSAAGEVVVEIAKAEDFNALYGAVLGCAERPGSRLVVRLPGGPLGNPALPTAVTLAPANTAGPPEVELVLRGPSASAPALLDNVTFSLAGRTVEVANVVMRHGARTALRAVIGERLLLDGVVVTGVRNDDPASVAVVEISVAPGRDATVELEDSWLVDNACWSGHAAGLAVRAGSGAGATVRLRRSGFVANSLPHELLADGARSVTMEDGAIIGPAQPEAWAGAALVAPGASVVLRHALVSLGGDRVLVAPGALSVDVQDELGPTDVRLALSLKAAAISSTASVHDTL